MAGGASLPEEESRTLAIPGSSLARKVLRLVGPVLVEQLLLYLVSYPTRS